MDLDLQDYAAFAERLADAARAETLAGHGMVGGCEDKNDGGAFDPVTDADRAAERAMRALIEAAHPDHGIQGEEYAARPAAGSLCWSLDPIDGTRAYICGLPSWTTLIALLREGRPVLGVIDTPRLGERYVGFGTAAWLAGAGSRAAIRVGDCRSLSEARLSTTDPYLFAGADAEAFARVRRAVKLTRYGLDAYGYARLAAGGIDLVVESGLKPHDYNALIPVVRGAGGVIGDWRGGDDFAEGAVVAAATPALYDATVRLLAG